MQLKYCAVVGRATDEGWAIQVPRSVKNQAQGCVPVGCEESVEGRLSPCAARPAHQFKDCAILTAAGATARSSCAVQIAGRIENYTGRRKGPVDVAKGEERGCGPVAAGCGR